eukprot:4967263-Pleurochrysis_carterae.AAC.1
MPRSWRWLRDAVCLTRGGSHRRRCGSDGRDALGAGADVQIRACSVSVRCGDVEWWSRRQRPRGRM